MSCLVHFNHGRTYAHRRVFSRRVGVEVSVLHYKTFIACNKLVENKYEPLISVIYLWLGEVL